MKRITLTIVLISSVLGNYFIGDDILNLPRYKVSLLSDKISQSQLQDVSFEQNMVMRDMSGQPFLCHIPTVTKEEREQEPPVDIKEETQDVERIIEKGLELLKPLENNCLQFYKTGDQYWSFEYCHNQHVRQFHIEQVFDGKVETKKETHSNYLGLYPKTPNTVLKQVGDQRSLVQHWSDGSLCDITGKPRSVEVQYQCDYQGHDRISYFTEVSSCHYNIVISTPRLCEEMKLSRLHKSKLHPISCKPIVSDKLIEAEQQQQQQQQIEQEEERVEKETKEQSKLELKKQEESVLEMMARLNQQLEALKSQVQNYLPNEQQPKEIPLVFVDEQGNPISDELRQLLTPALKKKEEKPKLIHGFQ